MGTNGLIERLFRTLKEQAIHGRTFQTIDELRDVVRDFAARSTPAPLASARPHAAPHRATACPESRLRYTGYKRSIAGFRSASMVSRGDSRPRAKSSAAVRNEAKLAEECLGR
jgi:hypothetical protein